jgi:hypothetical protein
MTIARNVSLIERSTSRREPAVHLALIEGDRGGSGLCGGVQIGSVGKHDVGALAASLQPYALHVGFAGVDQVAWRSWSSP